uniref:aminodeoxychorismate synthase n=1 Tax=Pinguiococcus pyrenoidosus TaxID=172671 RepID=A0A7R9UDA3_9STRA|mmetsp:Transcript_6398/g.24834  ORF Transcript_6398/g.24834 Transcript_6398/m.24834 type:complete len:873 (+) Transcript_6398:237-2855(+)
MRFLALLTCLVLGSPGTGFRAARRPKFLARQRRWAQTSAASEDARVRTLLVDNYDSYTYNLFQLLSIVNGCEPVVITNDQFADCPQRVFASLSAFESVVLSPGPGRPDRKADFGICEDLLRDYEGPLLGVCLGHQGLGVQHGAVVSNAPTVMHGRLSRVYHSGEGLFQGIRSGAEAVRYHSLIVEKDGLLTGESELRPTAWTEDGIIMALQHESLPHYGVQFHPESIGTAFGRKLLTNFRDLALQYHGEKAGEERRSPEGRDHPLHLLPTSQPPKVEASSAPDAEEAQARSFDLVAGQISGRIAADDVEGVFCRIFGAEATSFWLDSSSVRRENAGRGNPHEARWSYMGAPTGPEAFTFTYRGPRRGLMTFARNASTVAVPGDVFSFMERTISQVDVGQVFVAPGSAEDSGREGGRGGHQSLRDELKRHVVPFVGGLVGYVGYEVRHDLSILRSGAARQPDSEAYLRDPNVPDAFFLFADRLLAYDHADERMVALHLVPAGDSAAREQASAWCRDMARRIGEMKGKRGGTEGLGSLESLGFRPSTGRDEYEQKIDACHEYIRQGESYEICLTTQLTAPLPENSPAHHPRQSLEFYRRLRRSNPAPYGAYLFHDPEGLLTSASQSTKSQIPSDAFAICCSSPERFLRVRDGVVESKPIKGTVRRNKQDRVADKDLARELEQSVKNRAENLMIVDLVRNDLGRICEVGSVWVPRLMAVETYETVHQLVSTVRGQLRRTASIVDAIRACFPGGSMTGAPKVRTLDIIHDLEGEIPRGVYSGTLGFVSASGNSDLNIVIRTAVITPSKVTVGAGGAVTALSDRRDEYEEMLLKAEAVTRTVGARVLPDNERLVEREPETRTPDRRENFTIPEALLN